MSADDYVRLVSYELRDLPWKQRRDLVSEIESHLAELPPETNFRERLGPPERYAADMRAAAGLERRRGPIAFVQARRPRNLVLTVLSLIVLGLAIGFVAWVDSYQPLVTGNAGRYPAGVKGMVGSDIQQVAFRQGAPFAVGVSVMNNGRFTVRVLGVQQEAGLPFFYLPLRARLVMAGPVANHGGFPQTSRRFRPFDLKPGQAAYFVLKGTYDARCHPARHGNQDFWEIGGFEVRYGFLWRTGTAEIPLPSQLQINGPKSMSCTPPDG